MVSLLFYLLLVVLLCMAPIICSQKKSKPNLVQTYMHCLLAHHSVIKLE